jgi:hypothetical protein
MTNERNLRWEGSTVENPHLLQPNPGSAHPRASSNHLGKPTGPVSPALPRNYRVTVYDVNQMSFCGPLPFAHPRQSRVLLVLEPRAALAALLTGDLDFYTAAGTVGRSALRGVPVRVVMVSFNRSDLVLLASRRKLPDCAI